MDYRLIINSAVWPQRLVVYTTFLLCQPQHQIPWKGGVDACGLFVYVSVCKTQCGEKSGCTKGMADPLLHGVSFLKLEQSDWPLSSPTDLNFMTMAGNYSQIHSSKIFTRI